MTDRPALIWPLALTAWVGYAGVHAALEWNWAVVVCAALTLVVAWALYATRHRR